MLFKKIQLVFILGLFALGLTACGGDDSDAGSSSKSQSMTSTSGGEASSGAVEAYDPDVPSMVVEDNGVVHQEEIYKAWPQ
jgi:hypothetical protein